MRHKIFIAFLSLLTATSTLDMAKAQSLPYKNKNLPIEERVEDLLNRMTVDEKIAQIRHIHSSKIFNRQELDMKKLTDWAGNTSWGFVEGFPLTGDNCAKSMYLIQKYMVEKPGWEYPSSRLQNLCTVLCTTEPPYIPKTSLWGAPLIPNWHERKRK